MPLKIAKDPQFWTKVTVCMPVDNGHRDEVFRVRFRHQPTAVIAEYKEGTVPQMREFLEKTITDIKEVVDDQGKEIPFSPDLLDQLLGVHAVMLGMWNQYLASVTKARAGN